MCNALVCMAVWMCYSARTTTDKILAIIRHLLLRCCRLRTQHCHMYFIPVALFIKDFGIQILREIARPADFPH